MRNQENKVDTNEVTLVLFIIIAGWALLFYSGLF
ncbi:hypothetical protein BH24ACI2_BH24ACI2_11460 [soil metagenome]